jgi:AraC family transcriptional regulator
VQNFGPTTSYSTPQPVTGHSRFFAGASSDGLVGGKYETAGCTLLASSADLQWGSGLGAELRRHTELHCQSFFQPVNELAIAVAGKATIQRRANGPEQKFVSQTGLACLCPRGVDVRYLNVSQGQLDMLHLYLPSDLCGLLESGDDAVDAGLIYTGGIDDPLVRGIGTAIAEELSRGHRSTSSSLVVDSLSTAITARLVERYARVGSPLAASALQVSGRLEKRRLNRVLEFIDTHATTAVSLDVLAAEACLSRYHFIRAFKRTTGLTPLAYVNNVRMDRAKSLLRSTKHTVEDISAMLSFSSASNFARSFKRTVGLTPGDYRCNGR